MPGEAIWRHIMLENPSAAGTPPWIPLGELTALPRPHSWWRGGWLPLPKTPDPALGPSGLASPAPTWKLFPTPLGAGTVSIRVRVKVRSIFLTLLWIRKNFAPEAVSPRRPWPYWPIGQKVALNSAITAYLVGLHRFRATGRYFQTSPTTRVFNARRREGGSLGIL